MCFRSGTKEPNVNCVSSGYVYDVLKFVAYTVDSPNKMCVSDVHSIANTIDSLNKMCANDIILLIIHLVLLLVLNIFSSYLLYYQHACGLLEHGINYLDIHPIRYLNE